MDAYHAEKGVATCSGMKTLMNSASKYNAEMNGEAEEKEKKAFVEGRRLHCAVLEPERFASDYVDIQKPKFEGKGTRARLAEWRLANPKFDTEYNLGDKRDYYIKIAERVRIHPEAKKLLPPWGESEKEFRREIITRDGDKVWCKCRFDFWYEAEREDGSRFTVGVDLKFVSNSSNDAAKPERFYWDVLKYGYHFQQAWYQMIEPVDEFWFIAVEKQYPHDMGVYSLPLNLILEGDEMIHGVEGGPEFKRPIGCLQTFANYLKTDTWPGYPVGRTTLEDPRKRR